MTKKQVEDILSSYKKGTYIKMKWKTKSNYGVKIVDGVVRFTNTEIMTSKKGDEYINIRTTHNITHIKNITYINVDGEIISKEEYESHVGTSGVNDYFRKRLEDIISIR